MRVEIDRPDLLAGDRLGGVQGVEVGNVDLHGRKGDAQLVGRRGWGRREVVHGYGHGREADAHVVVGRRRGGGYGRERRGKSALAADPALQLGDHRRSGFDIRLAAGAGRGHLVGQDIRRAQQHPNEFGGGRDLVAADIVEQGFEDVGVAHQRLKAERARAALDRVHGPEDGVHGLGVALAGLHGQQAVLQVRQELVALLEERQLDLLEFVHRRQAATRRMASTSLSGWNGLTIQPVAPARRARSFLAGSLSVVSTRIGVAR